MVDFADLKKGVSVLDPQTGSGVIVKEVLSRELVPRDSIFICEIDTEECLNVRRETMVQIHTFDFLEIDTIAKFDRIISVPPFDNWKTHFYKAYQHLYQNGILVALLPLEAMDNDFASWLDKHSGQAIFTHKEGCPNGRKSFIVKVPNLD